MSRQAETPSQEEVDAIAHYCVVAKALEAEPFLGEDNQDKLGRQGTQVFVELEHPALFNSALSHFRKLWMKKEPSFYNHVRNILYRFQPNGLYNGLRHLCYDLYERQLRSTVLPDLVPVSNENLLELWINTQFAHAGKSPNVGRFSKKDFDALEKKVRRDVIEFTVRMVVKLIAGGPYLNVYRLIAQPELKRYEKAFELRPSFQFSDEIESALYKKLAKETPVQILRRLLQRQKFRNMATLARHLFGSPEQMLIPLTEAQAFNDLLKLGGGQIVEKAPIDQQYEGMARFVESHPPWRSGGYQVFASKRIIFEEKGHAIMETQFLDLRKTFFDEQSHGSSWDVW